MAGIGGGDILDFHEPDGHIVPPPAQGHCVTMSLCQSANMGISFGKYINPPGVLISPKIHVPQFPRALRF